VLDVIYLAARLFLHSTCFLYCLVGWFRP